MRWLQTVATLVCVIVSGNCLRAQESVANVVKQSADSVVLIAISNESGEETALGSGFLISSDGEIVTNYHVIKDAHSAIVKLSNGAFFSVEGVLASDSDKDLAIIKVPGRNLPFLSMHDANSVAVGEHVVAIGSPLGLEGTVSDGLVSAIREVSGKKWIQTTAPVSHGNSGGPLLDMSNRVVGVITWGVNLQLGQNLNFAIPSNEVTSILADSRSHPQPLGTKGNHSADNLSAERIWTSVKTGHDFMLRRDQDYLYVQRLDFPAKLKDAGVSVRSELKKSADGKWTGTSYERLPCETPAQQINWCSVERKIEIDFMSDTRIEGVVVNPAKFDCRKCQSSGELKPDNFTWIPK